MIKCEFRSGWFLYLQLSLVMESVFVPLVVLCMCVCVGVHRGFLQYYREINVSCLFLLEFILLYK